MGCQPSAQQQVKPGSLLEDLSTARLGLWGQYVELHGKVKFRLAKQDFSERNSKGPPCVGLFWLFSNLHVTRVNYTEDTPCDPLTPPGSGLARSSI